MFYYAYINESNIVTGVYSLPTEVTIAGYIPISQEQYENGNLVGKLYDAETNTFSDIPEWVCSSDEVKYKQSNTALSAKLDAMDEAIASASAGADGESAYAIAVRNGYVGSETEWLASLKGDTGEAGAAGTNGTDGVNGADGKDGTTVVVGTTTTGEAGTSASVSGILDESTNTLALNFTVPKGTDGASGSADTPVQVLDKIKTVDGAGSGLDADTLDGIEASGFATADHTHSEYASASHTHTPSSIGAAAESHTHAQSDITGLETALSGKANTIHTHSGYALTADLEALSSELSGKANAIHSHSLDEVSETDAKKIMTDTERLKLGSIETGANNYIHPVSHSAEMITGLATVATTGCYNDLSNKPTSMTPTAHTHGQSDINGLEAALNGKANATHTHSQYASLTDVYPIGSIYLSVNSTNPSEFFGGTWVAFGTGRVLMGVPSGGSAGITGGNETASIAAHSHTTQGHALTVAEMPGHQHELLNYNENGYTTSVFTKNSVEGLTKKGFTGNVMTAYTGLNQAHSHGNTGSAGAATISVVQPYITCYMWKRTA